MNILKTTTLAKAAVLAASTLAYGTVSWPGKEHWNELQQQKELLQIAAKAPVPGAEDAYQAMQYSIQLKEEALAYNSPWTEEVGKECLTGAAAGLIGGAGLRKFIPRWLPSRSGVFAAVVGCLGEGYRQYIFNRETLLFNAGRRAIEEDQRDDGKLNGSPLKRDPNRIPLERMV